MKAAGSSVLVSLVLVTASCVGKSTNGVASVKDSGNTNTLHESSGENAKWRTRDLVKLPPYDGVSHYSSFKDFQAQELLGVLEKIVEGEKKHIGLVGEWHLRGVHFDCIVDGKPSSGWFRITDAEKEEVELAMSPEDDILSKNGGVLSGVSLTIANHIYDICENIGCNISNIANIRVRWRAGYEGTFYKGTVYLNDDGSVRDRLYGSL